MKKIKKDISKTRVIVFTSNPLFQYRKAYMKYGADIFLDITGDFKKIPGILPEMKEMHSGKQPV